MSEKASPAFFFFFFLTFVSDLSFAASIGLGADVSNEGIETSPSAALGPIGDWWAILICFARSIVVTAGLADLDFSCSNDDCGRVRGLDVFLVEAELIEGVRWCRSMTVPRSSSCKSADGLGACEMSRLLWVDAFDGSGWVMEAWRSVGDGDGMIVSRTAFTEARRDRRRRPIGACWLSAAS